MLEPVVGQTYRFLATGGYGGWGDLTVTRVNAAGHIFGSARAKNGRMYENELFFYDRRDFRWSCEPVNRPEELINEDWS